MPLSEPDQAQIAAFKTMMYEPLGKEQGASESDIRNKLIAAWPYGEYRNEKNLTKAVDLFREIEDFGRDMKAGDIHELVKVLKIRNLAQLGQAEARAALERKESRLEHVREDYPFTDNRELKWVIVTGCGDDMKAVSERIPIEKWKYRPEPVLVNRLEPRKDYEK